MTFLAFRRAAFIRALALLLVAVIARPAIIWANDVTPPIAPPPRPAIIGFADTHLHQFANLGFGGLEVWGSPMDPSLDPNASLDAAAARALPDSDFVYVAESQVSNFLYVANDPVAPPLIEYCDNAGCKWDGCPDGTAVAGNRCAKITIHGPNGVNDELNKLVPHGSQTHGVLGFPDMNGWPAADVLTAQQAYWEWLQRAHQHGLKLMVMLAVNNSVLCQVAMHLGSFGCDDDSAVTRQIQGAKDLETYIDARAGGPGLGFYRIVYSSEEAREAIQAGKLAVVLGTEVDTAWGCTITAGHCDDTFIQGRVQAYHDAGIRVVYPVHLTDNKFGGSAVYTGLFELDNRIVNGTYFDMVPCGDPFEWRSDIRQIIHDAQPAVIAVLVAIFFTGPLAIPLIEAAVAILTSEMPLVGQMLPLLGLFYPGLEPFLDLGATFKVAAAFVLLLTYPGTVGSDTDGNCNNRPLTAQGQTLINALIAHKMIIDVDHADTPTFDAIMTIAEAHDYPGMVTGHTGLVGASLTRDEVTGLGFEFDPSGSGRHEGNKTDANVQRVLDVGGFVSLGLVGGGRSQVRDYSGSDAVAFNCGRSSQAFAQNYLYATKHLGLTSIGIGSDINGFAGAPAPRFGSKACAGDAAPGYDAFGSAGRLDYATATDYFGAPLGQYSFGNRTWDYNVDGFANAGLYPDFIADLRAINVSQADLAPLFNSAEAYVRMWEKVDDDEAPTVRCGTVGEAWHDEDVTVPCLSFDFGWGLADAADANFSLSTGIPDGTETDNAATGTYDTICDTAGHCTGTIPAIAGINVDKKDPSVIVTTPEAGTPTYIINAVVNADYSCSDGGSGIATCAGPVASGVPVDTTIGSHPFTVTGADNVAHVVNVPRPYNVTYAICLLYDPTKAHKAGSTVPIKISLCDAFGVNVSSASVILAATGVTQVSTSAPGPLEDAGAANPDNEFRFTNGSYVFNLQTTGMSTGTYALTFTATGDPIPHQVQFQVR